MPRPSSLPEWGTHVDAVINEPSSGKKAQGWLAPEKPTDGEFNWWWNLVYQWIAWLDIRAVRNVADVATAKALTGLAQDGLVAISNWGFFRYTTSTDALPDDETCINVTSGGQLLMEAAHPDAIFSYMAPELAGLQAQIDALQAQVDAM